MFGLTLGEYTICSLLPSVFLFFETRAWKREVCLELSKETGLSVRLPEVRNLVTIPFFLLTWPGGTLAYLICRERFEEACKKTFRDSSLKNIWKEP